MFTLEYTRKFKRRIKKLPIAVAEAFMLKKSILENNPFHPSLKTHKLGGNLRPYWSFSVDFENRVIFRFDGEIIILLITIGNHEIYKEIL
jgi:mRNA-degrading endonuclease YafQ of YafQ-DinJ toxin-antitoxin module